MSELELAGNGWLSKSDFKTTSICRKMFNNNELTEGIISDSATSLVISLQRHPELSTIVHIWSALPEHIKSAIQALIQTCIK
ncbi:MAG: hypothetical protein A2Y12_10045 [Planctomycetes bacterium GWF2_42_9]|nr:MAG: hypothetical protein A2Y12_10045 [Planctomycetes bacterium GWF2_42_9]